ncbi:MAG: ABC transporter substrate-binding protein [Candidatus Cyclobacteriaceae bacterium M3_2C_046]
MIRPILIFLAVIMLWGSCSQKQEQLSDKKVFRYNQADGLSSLDPAFARNQANIWATSQIYNGLFELSSDLYPVPSLASTWDISEDGKVYKFNIKKGIYFHDNQVFPQGKGREVKAEDFVYSFKRILDPATASTGGWIFSDKVKKNEHGKVADDWVVAEDEYTLKVSLDQPFGAFLEILTMPYTFVVPHELIEAHGKDFRIHPVGTGPFVFKSWDEGNNLILLKNDNYWKNDEQGQTLPYLDAIQVSFISDKTQELLTFQQKKLDFISYSGQANSIDLILNNDGTIKNEFEGQFVVEKMPYMNTEYIGFCLDPELYDDPNHPILNKKFRQALNYAINRKEMISYLLNNLGVPGTSGIIPPAITGFNKTKVHGYDYDPAKAETLLKEAGYGNGNLAELKLFTTIQSKPYVEYLQKQWEAIGIKVEIEINPVATHQELIDNAKVKFFRGSWLGDYPDAENYMAMFYSKNFSSAGPNKTHFKNERFDELYEKAKLEPNGFKRLDYYLEMDKIIVEEAPVIVLFYDEALRVTQEHLEGMEANPMNLLKLERVDFMQKQVVQASN